MSSLINYLNDPDIINEPMPLREVHAIRLMIQDEMKNFTIEERRKNIRVNTDNIMKKYGISNLLTAGKN